MSACWVLALTGCDSSAAPSYVLFGAYFPAWLLFGVLWLFAGLAVRVGMELLGGGTPWPWPLAMSVAGGYLLALGAWVLMVGSLP